MSLLKELEGSPNLTRLSPDLYLIRGMKGERLIASSLLYLAPRPLLIDAGMTPEDARKLASLSLVRDLHFTHMHLDHRVHQDLFPREDVTVPEVEREAFQSFSRWFELSGLPQEQKERFAEWRKQRLFCSEIPHPRGLSEGEPLREGLPAYFLALPGHTVGHSGVLFPELKAVLISDYDFEPFGPWYGNRSSDLKAYRASLLRLMHLPGIERYLTSHSRGVLTPEEFHKGALRYLELLEQRSARILEEIRKHPGITKEELIGKGLFYPPRALSRNGVLWYFERRMIELHLLELLEQQECAKDSEERYFPT